MNKQLIQHNIKQMEQQVEQGNALEAAKTALALAKLMLQSPPDGSPRSLYGAYGGTAVVLQECFRTLLETYQPDQDLRAMVEKIQSVNEAIAQCAAQREEIMSTHAALLARQKALEEEEKKLQDQKKELQEIINLEEKKIPGLKEENKKLREKLDQLETESRKALEEKERWMTVFDENQRLIGNLPDSVADQTADEIIAAAREYALQAEKADKDGDEWLRKVIAAVEQSKERMKQE